MVVHNQYPDRSSGSDGDTHETGPYVQRIDWAARAIRSFRAATGLLRLAIMRPTREYAPQPCEYRRPSTCPVYGRATLSAFGVSRKHPLGEFTAVVPAASLVSMQRLYSMFPTGRPGIALLLVRMALGLMLMDGVSLPLAQLGSLGYLIGLGTVAFGLSLGFLTPVMTVLCILLEVSTLFAAKGDIEAVHICAVLDAVAIGFLGPGAYSIDARLFGRRRIVFPVAKDRDDR